MNFGFIKEKVKESVANREAQPGEVSHSCVLSRHDHHNIELKTVYESVAGQLQSEVELYMFVPKTFQLSTWPKEYYESDIRPRIRLAVPLQNDQGQGALESAKHALSKILLRLDEAVAAGELISDLNHPLNIEITEASKELAAVVSETLKQLSHNHAKQLLLSHSLMTNAEAHLTMLQDFPLALAQTSELITNIRELLTPERVEQATVLSLLDEYISHLFVQYLGTIRSELSSLEERQERLFSEQGWNALFDIEECLELLQEKEALHRKRASYSSEFMDNDSERERQLVRQSQLKKYFQSRMFIDITRHHAGKTVSETVAAGGAALAGLWAALCQQMMNHPGVSKIAFSGVFIICLGIVAYALKDRIKDWGRAALKKRVSNYIADFEQQLFAEKEKIGIVREWLRVKKTTDLPIEVQESRLSASTSEIERRLPEDVLFYKKQQDIKSLTQQSHGITFGSAWAVQENVRINLERYLKHMDDPFKDITFLESSGKLVSCKSHRVYHFYACIRTKCTDTLTLSSFTRQFLYRIVLDKNGVDRVEEVL